jgi:hypothetical protein
MANFITLPLFLFSTGVIRSARARFTPPSSRLSCAVSLMPKPIWVTAIAAIAVAVRKVCSGLLPHQQAVNHARQQRIPAPTVLATVTFGGSACNATLELNQCTPSAP